MMLRTERTSHLVPAAAAVNASRAEIKVWRSRSAFPI
jgi:hypothetical protein